MKRVNAKSTKAVADKTAKASEPKLGKEAETRPRLNAKWHERHPMPERPSTEERIAWHVAHEKNCGCRPMPAKLRALMR